MCLNSRLVAFLLLLGAAVVVRAEQSGDEASMRIGKVLDGLHQAAAQADGAAYFALFAPDAVFIGTDASERWPVAQFKAYAEPIFATGKGWVYRPRTRSVTLADLPCRCVAWFDELLDSESYGTSRGTGVMVLREGEWKIAQYALSFPIPNDLAARMTTEIRALEAASPAR